MPSRGSAPAAPSGLLHERMRPEDDSTPIASPSPGHGSYKLPALNVLSEIATSLSSDSNLEDLLERFLSTMVKLAGAQAGAVRLVTADGKHLRLVGALGLPDDVLEVERYTPIECGVCGDAAHSHAVQLANDMNVCRHNSTRAYFGSGCKHVIAVPLRHKGKTLGVYNLFMASDTPVPEDVTLLFLSISEHLGMALENARLTRENLRITLMSERQMLANEVHDSLAQTLAYAKMRLPLLRETIDTQDRALSNKYLNDVDNALEQAYDGLRELLAQFRYRMDPRGLVPALNDLIQSFCGKAEASFDFDNRAPHLDLTPDQEVQVFHIIQEALANICKHARARHVKLIIESNQTGHCVTVEDDGIGLSPGALQRGDLHIGLRVMSERAASLGGEVVVESPTAAGTRVRLTFPALTRPLVRFK